MNKSKELYFLNLSYTIITIIAGLLIFLFVDNAKSSFTAFNAIACIFLFFLYLINFFTKAQTRLLILKKEAFYINYFVNILTFIFCIFLTVIASTICLLVINPAAANTTFIFTFFISTISMLMPSILFLVFIHFIIPALIIPNIPTKQSCVIYKNISSILFILFIIFVVYFSVNKFYEVKNFDKQVRFNTSKLTIRYSTNFLKINEVSEFGKRNMSASPFDVPFIYTTNSQPFADYEAATSFCNALNAKVPNYMETYHIVFNRFDTFGEKYYWTSNKDGKYPLVLHYKDMSYEIIRKPKNVIPELYCTASINDNYGLGSRKYFIRNTATENKENLDAKLSKDFDIDFLKNLSKFDTDAKQTGSTLKEGNNPLNNIQKEKRHVNFSVKEVPQSVFNELISKGYVYSAGATIDSQYETNEYKLDSIINKDTNNIRLCYFPFLDYGDMGIFKEKEIWQQSFCSPSFELINTIPEFKTKQEKDSYCYNQGGRLPNIPELAAILKNLGIKQQNVKFWTNTKVKDSNSHATLPVYVYYKDSRFMKVDMEHESESSKGYVFCIKNAQRPSSVIANYKSRFASTDGKHYARMQCPSCAYYEVPDVILQKQ